MTAATRRILGVLAVLALGVSGPAAPQEGAEAGAAAEEAQPQQATEAPAPTAAEAAAAAAVAYEREGFRDPFRSLLEQRPQQGRPRPPGPAGMLIEEIDLVGILAGPKGAMILVVGSDGLGYSLTEGAELYDGWVLRIDRSAQTVVFRQNVNDPTRIKPYRDIERRLDGAS